MSEITTKWYVLRAVGGKEKKAKEYIETEIRRLNLSEYIPQVVVPTEKIFQFRNGKKISTERVYYPGYVLIEAYLTGEIQHILRNISYISGFLTEGADKIPVPLRDTEVNKILGKSDEALDKDEENLDPFTVGDNVKIMEGPFNGFDGTIEDIAHDKKKLKVMVKIFGRKTLLELNFAQVVKE